MVCCVLPFCLLSNLVHCIWSSWNEWSQCTQICGYSPKTARIRTKKVIAQHNGNRCTGQDKETKDCDPAPCRGSIKDNQGRISLGILSILKLQNAKCKWSRKVCQRD